jgi:peptide/nickel transport system ATP-binding protein
MVFISHDLAVMSSICDRVLVMYRGQVVEEAPTDALFGQASHPYTRALLESVPRLGVPLGPRPPAVDELPAGSPADPACRFAPRCPLRVARCLTEAPVLGGVEHRVACHVAPEVRATSSAPGTSVSPPTSRSNP